MRPARSPSASRRPRRRATGSSPRPRTASSARAWPRSGWPAIARAAGVSAGLVHYHFDTKEQLFAEVLSYSSAVSDELTEQALAGPGRSRPSGCRRSSTAACPATSSSPTTGCSGRSSTCSASATRTWPRSGPRSTRTSTPPWPTSSRAGVEPGVFDTDARPAVAGRDRGRPVRRPRRAGPGARPRPRPRGGPQPRSRPPSGVLVGHDGPLPAPRGLRGRGRCMIPRPRRALASPLEGGFLTGGLALGATTGAARLRLHPRRRRGEPSCRSRPRRRSTATSSTSTGPTTSTRAVQGLPAGVRRQDHPVQLRLDGGDVRQDRGRQPVRHRLPDRQVGGQAARARARSAPSTTTSSPTPTRSSTPAPTTTTRGTTRSRPSRCRSPSTRPASAGAPTRSTR